MIVQAGKLLCKQLCLCYEISKMLRLRVVQNNELFYLSPLDRACNAPGRSTATHYKTWCSDTFELRLMNASFSERSFKITTFCINVWSEIYIYLCHIFSLDVTQLLGQVPADALDPFVGHIRRRVLPHVNMEHRCEKKSTVLHTDSTHGIQSPTNFPDLAGITK